MDATPLVSPGPLAVFDLQYNCVYRDAAAIRKRRLLRKRYVLIYAKMHGSEKRLKVEVKK